MVAIITATPWLNERINIIRFRKELEDDVTGSTSLCSRPTSLRCTVCRRASCVTTNWPKPQSRALYDALGTALGARSSPLMVVISTQAATDTAPMSELD